MDKGEGGKDESQATDKSSRGAKVQACAGGKGGTGTVAKFPYVWVRAFGNGGEGEVIVVELRRGPEFAGWDGTEQGKRECDDHGQACPKRRGSNAYFIRHRGP